MEWGAKVYHELRRALLHLTGDTRECPKCRHTFVPEDQAQGEGLDVLKRYFPKCKKISNLLPRRKSPKVVEAAKIGRIDEGLCRLYAIDDDGSLFPIPMSYGYFKKHSPQPGGYYVRYEDGYESYSPAGAFEKKWYTRIDGMGTKDRGGIIANCGNCACATAIQHCDLVECHRHAPAPHISEKNMLGAIWPVVKRTDCCSEHLLAAAEVPHG